MNDHTDQMVTFASAVLVKYFEYFGAKRPGDLEDDFCGVPSGLEAMMNMQGRWRQSPFYPALGRLVDSGKVYYWQDDDGNYWYDVKMHNKTLVPDAETSPRHTA